MVSCKQKALYVKACVILADTPDYHGDILSREDIKKVFTSYNNKSNFDMYHDEIPLDNVSMLENYICSNEEVISDTVVPSGSWIIVIRVDNPEVQEQLLDGDFGGVSLSSRVGESCIAGLPSGLIGYNDLKSADCIIPVLISLVDDPANMCGIEVMDYTAYIYKSKGGTNLSLFEELKALLQRFEPEESAEVVADAVEDNADSETLEEITDDISDAEPEAETEDEADAEDEAETVEKAEGNAESEPSIDKAEESEPIVAKAEDNAESVTVAKAEEPAETVEKAEGNEEEEDEVAELKAKIKELEEQLAEANKEEEPIVVKSAKIETTTEIGTNTKSFYELTGRDALTGKKIRRETKILN